MPKVWARKRLANRRNDHGNQAGDSVPEVQPMTPQELKEIEKLIQKHKPSIPSGAGFVTILFLLFLQGCFKGCGY
jgi:hypothetical protein